MTEYETYVGLLVTWERSTFYLCSATQYTLLLQCWGSSHWLQSFLWNRYIGPGLLCHLQISQILQPTGV